MNIYQENKCYPSKTVFKGGNSIKREKTDSISSTTSDPTYALQPEVSSSELDATSDSEKQITGTLQNNFAAGDMWRLNCQDRSEGVSWERKNIPSSVVSIVPMIW